MNRWDAIITLFLFLGVAAVATNGGSGGVAIDSVGDADGGSEGVDVVLVTGATGRLGSLLYFELRDAHDLGRERVRALVRDPEKARRVLGCDRCDETEGIYVGDVRDSSALKSAMAGGVRSVAIAVGASPEMPAEDVRDIEFVSVQSTAKILAEQTQDRESDSNLEDLRIVLCSSMGTTNPVDPFPGDVLFWKLNAEAFLGSSGIGSVVIKPCGLLNDYDSEPLHEGQMTTYQLLTGHDDALLKVLTPPALPRSEVARVMAEAVVERTRDLRFDLCAKKGPTTTDLNALLREARWHWEEGVGEESTLSPWL